MNLGVIRDFDFYPFTLSIPKGWRRVYLNFSQIDPLLRAGKLDASPYIYPSISFLPSGYKPMSIGVILSERSKSLVLVSKRDLKDLNNITLGVIQGYEQVLHCIENVLDEILFGKASKVRVFTDTFDADAFVIYGDRALMEDFGDYRFVYSLSRGEIKLAVWVIREGLEGEILPHLGNSLANWFMNTEKYVFEYSKRKNIDFEKLLEHAKSLKFKYEG